MPLAEALATVRVGMTRDAVKAALGEPFSTRTGEDDQEFWIYRCRDGRLHITFMNGIVYGRQ
jgi:outer membrane protein assembly factor BamE (lipoprotein component of BamABCDE complex)